mgnify:CR=1 FL=1
MLVAAWNLLRHKRRPAYSTDATFDVEIRASASIVRAVSLSRSWSESGRSMYDAGSPWVASASARRCCASVSV